MQTQNILGGIFKSLGFHLNLQLLNPAEGLREES